MIIKLPKYWAKESVMIKSVKIGSVLIDDAIVLAPMSGVTDLPFRRLVKHYGVGLVVTEMIASKAMIYQSQKTLKMATKCIEEQPMSVQLAGCEPSIMAEAAKLNEDSGASLIDINMGCPVKKVTNGDAGSALMKNEKLAGEILSSVVKAVKIPVTLKIRMGWDDSSKNAPAIAKIAEDSGIKALAVHGRTRCQFFKGNADWKYIQKVVSAVKIPVFGNGDINTVEDAKEMLIRSHSAGALIGRGTYGRPWFPKQVSTYLKTGIRLPAPSIIEQRNVVMPHYDSMLNHYGKTLSKEYILKNIWSYSSDADTHTVETHIYRLRQKIQDSFGDNNFITNTSNGYSL